VIAVFVLQALLSFTGLVAMLLRGFVSLDFTLLVVVVVGESPIIWSLAAVSAPRLLLLVIVSLFLALGIFLQ
jgi:hypothetical protein